LRRSPVTAPAGTLITDGTNDGWSVVLVGVHATAQQLLAAHAFVFDQV